MIFGALKGLAGVTQSLSHVHGLTGYPTPAKEADGQKDIGPRAVESFGSTVATWGTFDGLREVGN